MPASTHAGRKVPFGRGIGQEASSMQVAVITDEVRTVEASTTDGRVLVEPAALAEGLGWTLKAEGLCREDVCVPVRDAAALRVDGRIDLEAVAGALGRPIVVDAEAGLVAMALSGEQRRQALDGLHAPAFTLADLDGAEHDLGEWHGRKKLLVAFSTW
jgi:hypothetical protein